MRTLGLRGLSVLNLTVPKRSSNNAPPRNPALYIGITGPATATGWAWPAGTKAGDLAVFTHATSGTPVPNSGSQVIKVGTISGVDYMIISAADLVTPPTITTSTPNWTLVSVWRGPVKMSFATDGGSQGSPGFVLRPGITKDKFNAGFFAHGIGSGQGGGQGFTNLGASGYVDSDHQQSLANSLYVDNTDFRINYTIADPSGGSASIFEFLNA